MQGLINDLKTRKAVERNIEIIGEAMSRILDVHADINITDSRKIVDTRNRIIHAYEIVSPRILFQIIEDSLPLLYKEVTDLLDQ
jgi:uncharacterized protein with HEPN domain